MMLTDIKACLFDLDGTLIDSMWVWKHVDYEYLNKHGLKVPKDMGKDIEGASMREVAKYFKNRFLLSEDIDTIISDWNDMALYKYIHEVEIKPHVDDFLIYLKENNIKAGVFTSNSIVLCEAALKSKGIFEYFDAITAGCSDIKGKPEPDGYLMTADKLSVNPRNCLVFEDLVRGIKAGINAGMKTCAIKDEYSMYQDEEKRRFADYYIEDYNEIFKM